MGLQRLRAESREPFPRLPVRHRPAVEREAERPLGQARRLSEVPPALLIPQPLQRRQRLRPLGPLVAVGDVDLVGISDHPVLDLFEPVALLADMERQPDGPDRTMPLAGRRSWSSAPACAVDPTRVALWA